MDSLFSIFSPFFPPKQINMLPPSRCLGCRMETKKISQDGSNTVKRGCFSGATPRGWVPRGLSDTLGEVAGEEEASEGESCAACGQQQAAEQHGILAVVGVGRPAVPRNAPGCFSPTPGDRAAGRSGGRGSDSPPGRWGSGVGRPPPHQNHLHRLRCRGKTLT